MHFDFDQILAATLPPAATLTAEGRTYTLRQLSLADGAALDAVRSPREGESAEAHGGRLLATLVGFFDGEAPPFLTGPMPTTPAEVLLLQRKLTALVATVAVIVRDALDPKAMVVAATAAATTQLEAAGETD